MVTVDNIKNIQRIIDVLKADDIIFDNGETEGKLRLVEFGDPSNITKETNQMPYVYVTTSNNIQATSYPFGSTIPNNIHQTSVQYEIVLVAHARDQDCKQPKAAIHTCHWNKRCTRGRSYI